jgi:hypothetical protein
MPRDESTSQMKCITGLENVPKRLSAIGSGDFLCSHYGPDHDALGYGTRSSNRRRTTRRAKGRQPTDEIN